ncbi:MAG TPA: hypothetical protein VL945_00815 [Candidatus Saccharimonadales bacterium]|nr:hypothetical protein [Candidatus Saccharimonadales bacterium]
MVSKTILAVSVVVIVIIILAVALISMGSGALTGSIVFSGSHISKSFTVVGNASITVAGDSNNFNINLATPDTVALTITGSDNTVSITNGNVTVYATGDSNVVQTKNTYVVSNTMIGANNQLTSQ